METMERTFLITRHEPLPHPEDIPNLKLLDVCYFPGDEYSLPIYPLLEELTISTWKVILPPSDVYLN
jgi:hypothetical protein